jgi:hypothetical protein
VSGGQTGRPAEPKPAGADGATCAATPRLQPAQALRLGRHCPGSPRQDVRSPVTDDGVIVVEGLWWERECLTYVLLSDRQVGCRALCAVGGSAQKDDYLLVTDFGERVRDAAAADKAQQWAARVLANPRNPEHAPLDVAFGLAEPVPPRRVTEWRTIRHNRRLGFVPLFTASEPCEVPVGPMSPETGTDCICRFMQCLPSGRDERG